ncbi:Ubiquitin-conjugating enzyme E2 U [Lobulomyces angularis]|nr:Ubiquitin-conjugating enzyme E2 U [Lobulomyces angularis]
MIKIIKGPIETPWEGGIFSVELLFSQNYDEIPPEVIFTSVPFHPNIDVYTGKPCLDYLDDPYLWQPEFSITSLLLQLQFLLSNPILLNPINAVAADVCLNSPRLYEQLIKDSVVASRRIHAGLPVFEKTWEEKPAISKKVALSLPNSASTSGAKKLAGENLTLENNKNKIKTTKTSFENYYQNWKNLATSIPTSNNKPLVLSHIITKPKKLFCFGNEPLDEVEMQEILQKQHHLYFGKFPYINNTELVKRTSVKLTNMKRDLAMFSKLEVQLDQVKQLTITDNSQEQIHTDIEKEKEVETNIAIKIPMNATQKENQDFEENKFVTDLTVDRFEKLVSDAVDDHFKSNTSKKEDNLIEPSSTAPTNEKQVLNDLDIHLDGEMEDLVEWSSKLNETNIINI